MLSVTSTNQARTEMSESTVPLLYLNCKGELGMMHFDSAGRSHAKAIRSL